ncbi:hypothetical protein O5908_21945 [Escherichia coli]|nr:hypothetical protein [Escherichia coli]MCM4771311.1 hypothetical protein [Escherichia coli]MCM4776554.1 hypothetical protein [Escherichia coli]MCM5496643.1 hypothetical protein [Escherichia coli]MCN9007231.1 hypothetical protein [Escherichia coli]MCQ1972806.1 hypothetical protein [Escherichia coli]
MAAANADPTSVTADE